MKMEKDRPVNHQKQKTARPGWGNYFKEFLMLFLAVFCGYLAEDFREGHQEKLQAEELAHKFYVELKDDSVALEKALANRNIRDSALHFMRGYLKDSSLEVLSKKASIQFVRGFYMYTPTLFDPQDVILEQIRNGGTLAYFKDTEIQTLTGKLVAAMEKVRKRNESEGLTISQFISPFNALHSDPDWILGMAQYNGTVFDTLKIYERSPIFQPFHLVKTSDIDRLETYNRLGANLIAFTSTRKLTYRQYQKVNADLLKRLREVYQL